MAGNKINTKQKGKEDKNKSNKTLHQPNEESEELDFSLLRKPILTSITGFAQARKIFDWATEELKGLLSNECDLLYECKVCRNIFRSLANFISHKRVYCKETFNSTMHGHFVKPNCATNEILKIKRLEDGYQESLKGNVDEIMDTDETDDRIPLTKDLTAIIEKIAKNRGENISEEQHIVFQKIPSSSVAVFQSIEGPEQKQMDKMRAQVKELDNILSRDKAVLMSDGKFKTQSTAPTDIENVIQISDDDENDGTGILKCKICDQQFSTQKTLKFHMKYKHLESRLVYPCPDCLEIFSTSWSVYRHLFKVHRKTAAQIRKLRESIQAKAFKMNNPPAFYERRKNMKPAVVQKITEEERLDQENQAWMDNVEGDGDTPRCFGCGRSFERRAALVSHTYTCQPRSRALARRPPDAKKIEIQIRKDYHKGPPAALPGLAKSTDATEAKPSTSFPINTIKEDKEEDNTAENKEEDNTAENKEEELEEATMEILNDDSSTIEPAKSPSKKEEEKTVPEPVPEIVSKLPYCHQAEKSNLVALRQKIKPDADVFKLTCKKCDLQHNSIQELYDHMAEHYKWMRYACKLCNYKHYDFEKLPEHVKLVHKLKGDSEFYLSTVKAVDGTEALELSQSLEEGNDGNEVSPESRRPSRCSSDSSRLSDDSSSSCTRIESGSRKRKINYSKSHPKKRRDNFVNDDDDDFKVSDVTQDKDLNSMLIDNDSSSNTKTFEENSSDLDDLEDRISRKSFADSISTVASRRPIRKKTKPKNEDFEYDLSNLLKMEAQGYRDSQSVSNAKTSQPKKKTPQTDGSNNNENLNKDCCGALVTLSKKAVEKAAAHMKMVFSLKKDSRPPNIFVKPLPKISRGEKMSPRKDVTEDAKDCISPQKDEIRVKSPPEENPNATEKTDSKIPLDVSSSTTKDSNPAVDPVGSNETVKPNKRIPAVLPITFRRQSLEAIKHNPLINKNITDFTKAGMKTKILVIKPINRGKDSATHANTPLKFQTIKLKDPSKRSSSNEANTSDQVMVVKVPSVDCASVRPVAETTKENETKEKEDKVNKVISSEKTDLVNNNSDVTKASSDEVTNDTYCNTQQTNSSESLDSVPNKNIEIVSKKNVDSVPKVMKDTSIASETNKNSDIKPVSVIKSSENVQVPT